MYACAEDIPALVACWPVTRNPPASAEALLVVTVGFCNPFAIGPVMIV